MERARNYLQSDIFAPDEGRAPIRRALRTTLRTFVLTVRVGILCPRRARPRAASERRASTADVDLKTLATA
jgi:hypothetical protein